MIDGENPLLSEATVTQLIEEAGGRLKNMAVVMVFHEGDPHRKDMALMSSTFGGATAGFPELVCWLEAIKLRILEDIHEREIVRNERPEIS